MEEALAPAPQTASGRDDSGIARFPAARFQFALRAASPIFLPPYKGSALRGAFGHAFKEISCAVRRATCEGCLLARQCAYARVFETPVVGGGERGITTFAPHPFVLEPPLDERTEYAPGERIEFGLVLIGRALDLLPHCIYAVERMGERGLGKGRGRARLLEVRRDVAVIYRSGEGIVREAAGEDSVSPYPSSPSRLPEKIALSFLTPFRIKVHNRLTDSPTFADVVESLVSRVESLAKWHLPSSNGFDGGPALAAARQAGVLATDLKWLDWERYSARQETRMKMGGVVGRMEVEGVTEALRPWLALGELIHVGKGTSFGLGRYRVEGLRG